MSDNKENQGNVNPQEEMTADQSGDQAKKKSANPFVNPFFAKKEEAAEESAQQQAQESDVAQEETAKKAKEKPAKGKDSKDVAKIKAELEKVNNQYVRLAADFDNYRKRTDQEKQEIFKHSTTAAIKELLPALDNLDRAYLAFQTMDDPEKLKDSFNALYRSMQESIAKLKVEKIKTAGEIFDPNFHEAVMQEETTEYPDCAIMMELQPGYITGGKVIRAAMVKVASNPEGSGGQSCGCSSEE